MAVSPTTCFGPRAEMSILKTNQYLRSEMEKYLKEKFLTSKATAYSLACLSFLRSVLEEELEFEERELAELPRPAARLRIRDPLIQAQEGNHICYLFTQHVKNTVKNTVSFDGLLRNTGIA
uniref:Uncharacterized protein n=1 Tax=Cebus imitator TaxID=2715852 RepID=A0A2K5QGS7_CEBIM